MIIRPRPHWLRMLFVVRGSVLHAIAPQLIAATLFAVLVTAGHGQVFEWKIPLNFVPFSLIGLTLAIFLGFRNSTSYARYWEARTLWGVLLNESRTLLRLGLMQVRGGREARRLAMLLAGFVHTLRHQLRNTDPQPDLQRLLGTEHARRIAPLRHKPTMLLLDLDSWVRDRRDDGSLPEVLVPALEAPLSRLNNAMGGCERIASTPIPFTYAVLIHRTIYIYCLLLPFGLVDAIGVMTPVIVAFISYTFFALDALGAEIEEPFGTEPNDLALEAMSQGVEDSLREMLGETLPPLRHDPDRVVLL